MPRTASSRASARFRTVNGQEAPLRPRPGSVGSAAPGTRGDVFLSGTGGSGGLVPPNGGPGRSTGRGRPPGPAGGPGRPGGGRGVRFGGGPRGDRGWGAP